MEKHIYFVRHGESEENLTHIHIGKDAALTETGRAQARITAERIERLGVDALISSPFVRAYDTAAAIAERTGLTLESSELLGEWLEPSKVTGMHMDDPERQKVREATQSEIHNHDYRHSDEETFSELALRAKAVLQLLADHPAERICVVTHGAFLRVITGLVLFGADFTKRDFIHFMHTMGTTNTGITYVCHTEKHPRWMLITWNDQSHLG